METTLVERKTLLNIESRLGNVESTLSELLENGELMEERIRERLTDINDEIVKNTAQVRRLKSEINNSRYKPTTVLVIIVTCLVLWSVLFHWFNYS
jgi:hypothetical protein